MHQRSWRDCDSVVLKSVTRQVTTTDRGSAAVSLGIDHFHRVLGIDIHVNESSDYFALPFLWNNNWFLLLIDLNTFTAVKNTTVTATIWYI